MSFLAFGGEMGFFKPSDASAIEVASNFSPAFARVCTDASQGASYNDSATFTATADIWIHCEVAQFGSTTTTSTKRALVVLLDGSGVEQFQVTADYAASGGTLNWQLQYKVAGVWTNAGAAFATSVARQTLDIHVVCNSASGSFDVYVSGTQRAASGTLDLSGITGIAGVRGRGSSRVGGDDVGLSQVIVADESTIGMKLGTIVMTGQGTTHTFTTGGYANIDEAVYSDVDYIQSDTAAQTELFTGTPIPNFTGYKIRAVGVTARAKQSGTGPTKMRLCLRSAGTTYDNGSDITLDFGYGAFCAVWNTNPATSAAFLSTEIASLEYGVKSVA